MTSADHAGLAAQALRRLAADLEARDAVPKAPEPCHYCTNRAHRAGRDLDCEATAAFGRWWRETEPDMGTDWPSFGSYFDEEWARWATQHGGDPYAVARAAALRAVEVSRGLAAEALERLAEVLPVGKDRWIALAEIADLRRLEMGLSLSPDAATVTRWAEAWQAYAARVGGPASVEEPLVGQAERGAVEAALAVERSGGA